LTRGEGGSRFCDMSAGPTKLERARAVKGLTQEQLAAKAGVTVGTVSRIENRQHEPRVRTLQQLAVALGVDLDDLLEEAS